MVNSNVLKSLFKPYIVNFPDYTDLFWKTGFFTDWKIFNN